jgi:glutathione S-transferase
MLLYDNSESANGYKVQLLASFLGLPLEVRQVDIFAGESRTPEFLALNPFGQIPTLILDDGRVLPESNAILCHLGEGSAFLPSAGYDRSRVLSWLFFEQYSHEPYVATPRFILRHTAPDHPRRAELGWRLARGKRAIGVMDQALEQSPFLYGAEPTLADIALFAYTHRGHECGIELGVFPAVQRWIERIQALPRFIPMLPPEELKLVD